MQDKMNPTRVFAANNCVEEVVTVTEVMFAFDDPTFKALVNNGVMLSKP